MKPALLICRAGVVPYRRALELQYHLQQRRIDGAIDDVLLLLQHPPVYTLGRRGDPGHLVRRDGPIELIRTDRGGDITYHGPGQAVGYLILDLTKLYLDLQRLFGQIEGAITDALAGFGIRAGQDPDWTGVWVGSEKIAAIGLRVRRWVTMHGFALNVANDLAPFRDIVPCGLADRGVTSMARLGCQVSMDAVYGALAAALAARFDRRACPIGLPDLVALCAGADERGCPQTPRVQEGSVRVQG